MNSTIFLTTLRQRFASRTRLVLIAVVFLFPVGLVSIAHEVGLGAARTGSIFAFLLGAGILGQETSSGVMQLLFARPVRRWEYVLSRWLAVIAAATALLAAQIALLCLVMAARGLPGMKEIGLTLADQVLQAVGTTSVILFYSSFLSGVGDVLGIVLTLISAQILNGIGQLRQSPVLIRAAEEVNRFLTPQVPLATLMGGAIPWFEIVSYLSTVTLGVAVAVLVLNAREISYASE